MSSYIGGGRYENLNLNPNVGEKGPGGLTWNGTSWMQRGSEGYTGNLPGGQTTIVLQLDGEVLDRRTAKWVDGQLTVDAMPWGVS